MCFSYITGIICMIISVCSFPLAATSMPYEPFIFVRHGSTDWSLESVYQGVQDLSLNEQGKSEASLAADILISVINTDEPSYIIISSSLQRAADTAAIIADKTHIPILFEQDLQERYYGDFSLDKKCSLDSSQLPIDAEPEEVFQKRIRTIFNEIFTNKNIKNKKILVSHGEVFKYLSKLLTEKEETLPRGGVAMFIPISGSNSDPCWSIRFLTK